MRRTAALAAACGATPAAGALLPVRLRARPSGDRAFVDAAGRERYFHGTNAVTKGPPWVPTTDEYSPDLSMVDRDFEDLEEMGMTVLRLGVMWPGVEPTRGSYNESYLDEVAKIADAAAARGIYTLLDMHQDALSERFCGEGIPAWAAAEDGGSDLLGAFPLPVGPAFREYYAEPLAGGALFPARGECAKHKWSSYALSRAACGAYEALWRNVNGTLEAWAAMWAHVAARFKGRPHILGLELINEPFAGDFYHDPLLLAPWPNPRNADATRLQPAYDRVMAALRGIDDEVLVFFEGVAWGDAGPGFTAPPGGAAGAARSVLAYHYYEPPQGGAALQVRAQVAGARRLRTGAFLTETNRGGVELYEAADAALQSWAHWEYKSFCREDNRTAASPSQNGVWGACKTGFGPSPGQPDAYRTYAPAVAGNATSVRFDATTKAFRLSYAIDPGCALPTEIRVSPARNYPGGVDVAVDPPSAARAAYDPAADPFVVRVAPLPAARRGDAVTVTVTARGGGGR